MIYIHLLVAHIQPVRPQPKGLYPDLYPDISSYINTGTTIAILGVDKQIHDEAVHIYYRHNQLTFYWLSDLHAFLRILGTTRRRHITHVTIEDLHGPRGQAQFVFKTLRQCIRLRYLKVTLTQDLWKVKRFAGMKEFKKLRGLRDGP